MGSVLLGAMLGGCSEGGERDGRGGATLTVSSSTTTSPLSRVLLHDVDKALLPSRWPGLSTALSTLPPSRVWSPDEFSDGPHTAVTAPSRPVHHQLHR